jgi:uncharacterized protein YajQ (UPF0234 family)
MQTFTLSSNNDTSLNIKNISLDTLEIKLDNLQIDNNPMDMFCNLKIWGDYVYDVITNHKWSQCPELSNQLIQMINREFSNININPYFINKYLSEAKNNHETPTSTKYQIINLIESSCQTRLELDNIESVQEKNKEIKIWFEIKNKIYDQVHKVYSQYNEPWFKLDEYLEKITSIVNSKYKHLELEPEFIHFMNRFEYVKGQAIIKVNNLVEQLKQEQKEKLIETCKQSKNVVNQQIDEKGIDIFIQLLKSNNFEDKYINILAPVFKTELSMVKLLVVFDDIIRMPSELKSN